MLTILGANDALSSSGIFWAIILVVIIMAELGLQGCTVPENLSMTKV
jgi:hypothetical protein